MRTRAVTLLFWSAVVVTICALAGGWDGLIYGSVGLLAGTWIAWTSEQYARTE